MRGLFVGLTTLDIIQYVKEFPAADAKIEALDRWIGAGGPAANASITFAALGGEAELVTALGRTPVAEVARRDLESNGVIVRDVARSGELAISSIIVDRRGRRTVVSVNAAGFAPPFVDVHLEDKTAVVLADGHNVAAALPILDQARDASVPTIFDGGSRKPHTAELLARMEFVLASSAFAQGRPPQEIANNLLHPPVRLAAVSSGDSPITGATNDGPFTVEVPQVQAVDTLGAGDILHGAFAYHLCSADTHPIEALRNAANIASISCTRRGPRLV